MYVIATHMEQAMHLTTTAPAGLNVDEVNAFRLLMIGALDLHLVPNATLPAEVNGALQFAATHDLGQLFGTPEAWVGIASYEVEFFCGLVGQPAPYTGPGVDFFVGHMHGSHF
jgi:hypothetical protein